MVGVPHRHLPPSIPTHLPPEPPPSASGCRDRPSRFDNDPHADRPQPRIAAPQGKIESEGRGVGGWHYARLSNPPGHLWRDKWTALSGPLAWQVLPPTVFELGTSCLLSMRSAVGGRCCRQRCSCARKWRSRRGCAAAWRSPSRQTPSTLLLFFFFFSTLKPRVEAQGGAARLRGDSHPGNPPEPSTPNPSPQMWRFPSRQHPSTLNTKPCTPNPEPHISILARPLNPAHKTLNPTP